jgi:hypothetical protein
MRRAINALDPNHKFIQLVKPSIVGAAVPSLRPRLQRDPNGRLYFNL